MPEFVHLHCHSEYSLLDGAIRTSELANRAAELGMPAVALTDHGNLFGAIEFFKAAKKAEVKPILGMEAYIATKGMRSRQGRSGTDNYTHLTLLAANAQGWANLIKISTAGYLEGFYYKPRVDREFLAKHAAGLIVLSGCVRGDLCTKILAGDSKGALESAAQWRDIFGAENYFIELHNHGLESQRKCLPELVRIAKELGLELVAANDAHFLLPEHHASHDVLVCIGTSAMLHDTRRMHYSPEVWFKPAGEMAALFSDLPQSLTNTLAIAERCHLEIEFDKPKYPNYQPPPGYTRETWLRKLCEDGLAHRYGERAATDPALRERLDFELSVLEKTRFVSYFLIVWDFIHHAKTKGIPVGPGRGSAAGSLVAYVLGITDIDPLRFDLLFERFLNPDRVSPPDIDVDFCMNRRGEVIEYVRQKYGERSVSQIVTFGTLGAKSVVRDVARVLGWSYSDADRLARMIPEGNNETTLETAAAANKDLRNLVENDEPTKELWTHALRLEGLCRNTGIHAAGVVIADGPLSDHIPLCRGRDNEVVTQFEMKALESLGMLKMDFLGLKTLTVIDAAVKMVRQKQPDFRLEDVPLDDSATFAIYNRGETVGVFQMEGAGITDVCRRFDVGSLEDIIAVSALYRPGPKVLIDNYIACKRGKKKPEYAHPLLEKVCADTFGIIVYQEQVQRAANVLAGYNLAQADLLRRAMGKKDAAIMAKEKARFIEGCGRLHNIPPDDAAKIFEFIERFANYGFNKSHSAAYGLISYRTAYLKAHFPVEFMAAMLTHDASDTERLAELIAECRRLGIRVLPPDINAGAAEFVPVQDLKEAAIRFGLASIKNVGSAAVEAIVAERQKNGPFTSLENFCLRLDNRTVNRKTLESLVRCGAFDSLDSNRARVFARIENAMAAAAGHQRDRSSGQAGLFDILELTSPPPSSATQDIEPWPISQILSAEKELLGFYITGHPLQDYAGHFQGGKILPIEEVPQSNATTLKVAGIISSVGKKISPKDKRPFFVVVLEDFTGSLELTAWEEAANKYSELLKEGEIISATIKVHKKEDKSRLYINSVAKLKPRPAQQPVRLRLLREKLSSKILEAIRKASTEGERPLILEIEDQEGRIAELTTSLLVSDAEALEQAAGCALKSFDDPA